MAPDLAPPPSRSLALRRAAQVMCAVVAAVGVSVLLGYYAHVERLTTAAPGLVPMRPNTALALLLLGLGLLTDPRSRRLARAPLVVVQVIGGLTLLEVATGTHHRLDVLLPWTGVPPAGAQMAPATAVALTLLALSSLAFASGHRRVQQGAALLALCVGYVAVIGYVYGASHLYGVWSYSSMAIHTAVSVVLLSLALLAYVPDEGMTALLLDRGGAGRLTRALLPFLVLGAPVIGWLLLKGQRAGWYDTQFAVALLVMAITVGGVLLLVRTAQEVRVSDRAREAANADLGRLNARLEGLVYERTAELAEVTSRFRAAFDSSPFGSLLTSVDGTIEELNAALPDLVRQPRAALLGTHVRDLFLDSHEADDEERLTDLLARADGCYQIERQLRVDGAHAWVEVAVALVHHEDGQLGLLYQLEDVTRRRLAEDRAQHMALHDALTNLPNRLLLLDRLQQALAQAARSGHGLGVLFVDLDRFKVVNDSLGHQAGDAVLVEVAHRLRGCARAVDTVARLGGDEFVVVCPEVHDEHDLLRVAETLRRVLTEPMLVEGTELVVEASIGVALGTAHDDPELLLRQADQAMYRAKDHGRARLELFNDDLRSLVSERLDVELALRGAVSRGEIETWFQPIVDLQDGSVPATEALVRWRRASGGLVLPGAFVRVAEDVGLIREIGATVLHQACAAAAAVDGLTVSVNVSARQFVRTDFETVVEAALAETGLPPDRLWLELTESAVVDAIDSAARSFQALRNRGVRIAIDDFGTGFSSFAHLKHFPVDLVKVDGTFVRDLLHSEHEQALVEGIISLAGALHLEVVAEGIEEPAQAERLAAMGCRFGQGFLYAEPSPIITPQLRRNPLAVPRPRPGLVSPAGVARRPAADV